jgi:hypothetical protein
MGEERQGEFELCCLFRLQFNNTSEKALYKYKALFSHFKQYSILYHLQLNFVLDFKCKLHELTSEWDIFDK